MAFSKAPNLALLFVDKNGTIKFINERFEQIFELESKKFYRSKFSKLALEIDEFGQIQDIQNLPNFTQNFIIKRDKIYFRVVVCAVLESGKNFDGFIMTLNDITHEKELENAVVEHERMLISNTKMAVVGEMINSISHQQRQPLSTIMLCMDNIKECIENHEFNEVAKYIKRAKKGINLMNETINSFRSFYKNDDKSVVFDVKSVIDELIFIVKSQMNTNGILLEFHYENGEFLVYGVASYLKQVLLSLLSNSKDELTRLMQENFEFEPKICIELKRFKSEIYISISDNGGGINADETALCDPFYTTKDTGTGMGLYIAKILAVEKLGGRFVLESRVDPTKFAIFLKSEVGSGRCITK
ncbi:PAS domain-containing sensor histidine kinase [Campylobacter curvus]|uniref:PAS domain-containing sensor histidine kinase n=1 Tax=Campylobacter curvus TaxID=200 RepID=UPI00146FD7C5|nr:PAS domain-containing sensor histidine kinase [Campylobacter curvus]